MPPPLTGIVLYSPAEVMKWEELDEESGWWVGAALRNSQAGDRLVVYRTTADQGIVGVWDIATASFEFGELGWAAYGRPTPLRRSVPRAMLIDDAELRAVFKNLQRRRYLPTGAATRIQGLLPALPIADSGDPIPRLADPDWQWTPIARRWGNEPEVSSKIARHKPAWSAVGFLNPPAREQSPYATLKRTDLKGIGRRGAGLVAEVKHFVAESTLAQVDGYLREARLDGGEWLGALIALASYTTDVSSAISDRDDMSLWVSAAMRISP